jgi:hypothetical protein
MSKSFIPDGEAEYDEFFENTCAYTNKQVISSNPHWKHIPMPEVESLNEAYTGWYDAYTAARGPHLPAQTAAKEHAHKESRKVLARFIQVWFRGFPDVVTPADLRSMNIPEIDTTHTPVPRPRNQAEADVTYPGTHLIELVRIRSVAGGSDDPRADWGQRIYYGILDPANPHGRYRIAAPPVTGEDLPHSVFTRTKKHRFDFDGDSGKTVYFSIKYENEKGGETGEGPYGPIFSAIIP